MNWSHGILLSLSSMLKQIELFCYLCCYSSCSCKRKNCLLNTLSMEKCKKEHRRRLMSNGSVGLFIQFNLISIAALLEKGHFTYFYLTIIKFRKNKLRLFYSSKIVLAEHIFDMCGQLPPFSSVFTDFSVKHTELQNIHVYFHRAYLRKKLQLGKLNTCSECYLTCFLLVFAKQPIQERRSFCLTLIGCTPQEFR